MKRTFITFIVFAIIISRAFAQQVDYNKIILPDEAANISFEEKLVQLAWKNNPASAIVQGEAKVAQYEAKAAGGKWLGLFGAQGNLNEFTIKRFTGSSDNDDEQFILSALQCVCKSSAINVYGSG